MKIAVLADIHANLAALHVAVADIEAWSPDMVVVAGDMVNRGPLSRACLELCLQLGAERGWRVIQGNHEGYVIKYDREHRRPEFPAHGPHREINRMIAYTHAQLSDLVPAMARLPDRLFLDVGGEAFTVYHASVRHNRDGVLRRAGDRELRDQIDRAAAVFCIGHTHMPFVHHVDQTLVVNVGSVGLPFDGDPRPAYARLTRRRAGWHAEIVRLAYDIAQAERDYRESGMLDAVGPMGAIMLRELLTGQSLLFDFVPLYYQRIVSGALSVEAAVAEFLVGLG